MIGLPPIRDGSLQSFGIAIALLVGISIGIASSLPGMGAGVALGGIFLARLRPRMLSLPYRAWNRLARQFARYARLWLTAVCFHVIVAAVGRGGAALRLTRSTESMWVPRETLPPAAYAAQGAIATKHAPDRNWVWSLLSWTWRSGNLWIACLVPFLVLLSLLETDDEDPFPSGIYTLF